uniref:Abortive infection protein n=1 Tax=Solibacter usitatus (strain Ellin6076) TaxID=234267 RepID=Q01ZN2_SOLUE
MQTLCLALLLAAIFALLAAPVQGALRRALKRRPGLLFLAPPLLTAIFLAAMLQSGTPNTELLLIVFVYTLAPTLCCYLQGPAMAQRPGWLDFTAIALLWMPLEFPAGAAQLIAKHAQGFLHSVAYGIAILLGLILFLGFRGFPGMKYNPPRGWSDITVALAGYAITAPVLMLIGIWIGFIPGPRLPTAGAGKMAAAAAIIFAATALPEEILFRAMIQNLLMLRFGAGTRTLLAASVIFGAAHLDNGPQPLPNWRYMILATIAGYAYGKVFERSRTILSSTLFHCMVDWTKHFFF